MISHASVLFLTFRQICSQSNMIDDTSGAGTTYLCLRGTAYLFLCWVCVVHFVQLYVFTVLVQYFDVLYNYQEQKPVGFYLHLFL
jgi:hypothetical protein